ncbi:hypothetical protein AYO38_08440 [bacterium SCGC AG-212-C10]|nr:hypothetical protein AYO38_08440 [bacterium SCGC AG-212-C10]
MLLVSLMLAMFVSGLNQSVVATATPKMLADLGGFELLPWVFTVYLLSSTVCTPLVGKLSDIYGRKVFLLGGIALFVLASAGCGAAMSMPMLIAFRVLQGLGGGTIMACVVASIGDLFPPAERGKYIGLFVGTMTMSALVGPAIGGLLTDHVSWRACFYVNVPVAALAMTAIWINLPSKQRSGKRRKIDYAGAMLLSAATTTALLALTWAHRAYGWESPQTISMIIAALVLLAGFIAQERRHPEAILPPEIFRSREFVVGSVLTILFGAATQGTVQYLPTFVQTAMQGSATASGLVTTPQSLAMLLTSVVGGQVLSRTGRYKVQVMLGVSLTLSGTIMLQTLNVGDPSWHIAIFMVFMGLGSGLVMPTMSVITQNAVSHEMMGVVTAARQFSMQIGAVTGVAVFGAVLASSYESSFSSEIGPEASAAIGTDVLEKFHDPTLALNQREFAIVQEEVRGLDDGEALLASAVSAQQEGVASAVRDIYRGAAAVVFLALLSAVFLRELPLRKRGETSVVEPASPRTATAEG